jgi:hypothetical protein
LKITNLEPPIVNSNVFYARSGFEVATKAVDSTSRIFIIEEDL